MKSCKSFLNPKTCGFRRTAVVFVTSSKQLCEENGSNCEKYEEYCSMFGENIEYVSFISNANRLKVLFQKWGKRKRVRDRSEMENLECNKHSGFFKYSLQ